MSRSFDYRSATLEAIAERLQTVQNQAFSKLITYYTAKGDEAMLAKLRQARMLSKLLKLQQEYHTSYPTK